MPIGLIHTSWGGTPAESWTPRQALEAQPTLKHMAGGGSQLYNGMIHPLIRLPIAGAIWYQGESNVGKAAQYHKLFPAMIEAWREAWHQPKLPFYFVQIAPYRYNADGGQACAELWDAQFQTMQTLPNTGMAVITDSASVGDIHPRTSASAASGSPSGHWPKPTARATWSTPARSIKSAKAEVQVDADTIRLSFDSIGSGLASRDGKPLTQLHHCRRGSAVPARHGRDRRRLDRGPLRRRHQARGRPFCLERNGRAEPDQQRGAARIALPHRRLENGDRGEEVKAEG